MIELKNINKTYGSLTVLSDISLTIGRNEIITIVGPSGAGKTTLLQIAGSLERPDSGQIIYDGEDISTLNDKRLSHFRNRNIGFIFQFHQLLPEFTACENVALPAMIGGMSRRKAMEKASGLLDMLGLSERKSHKPAEDTSCIFSNSRSLRFNFFSKSLNSCLLAKISGVTAPKTYGKIFISFVLCSIVSAL